MANEIKSVSLIAYPASNSANAADSTVLVPKGYVDGFFGKGTWNSQAGYSAGDIVAYGGSLYRVKTGKTIDQKTGTASNTAPSSDTTNWESVTVFGAIQTASAGVVVEGGGVISVPTPIVADNITTYTVSLAAGDGLDGTTAGTIKIDYDSDKGLTLTGATDGSKQLAINAGDGLGFVSIGSDKGKLRVELNGTTLSRNSNGLSVNTAGAVAANDTGVVSGGTVYSKFLEPVGGSDKIKTDLLPTLAVTNVYSQSLSTAEASNGTTKTGRYAQATVEAGDIVIETITIGSNDSYTRMWMYVGSDVNTPGTDSNWIELKTASEYAPSIHVHSSADISDSISVGSSITDDAAALTQGQAVYDFVIDNVGGLFGNFVGEWTDDYENQDTEDQYVSGDVVVYGGKYYCCITGNSPSNGNRPGTGYWKELSLGLGSASSVGVVQVDGGTITAQNGVISAGVKIWSSSATYAVNEVVAYNGKLFTSYKSSNTNNTPLTTTLNKNTVDGNWQLLGGSYRGQYSSTTDYHYNDLVNYGASLYVCKYGGACKNQTPTTTSSYWLQLPVAVLLWQKSTAYNVGDVVLSGGVLYKCVNDVTATTQTGSFSTTVSGTTYWQEYAGSQTIATTQLSGVLQAAQFPGKSATISGATASGKKICTIPHGYTNNNKLIVQVYDKNNMMVLVDTKVTTTNVVLTFAEAIASTDTYYVYICPINASASIALTTDNFTNP